MKRSEFIRNMIGSLAAAVIGSRLESFVIAGKPEAVPFVIHVAPNSIKAGNIIQSIEGRQFYVNAFMEAVLLENPAIRVQLIEDADIKPTGLVLCSACPERSTVKALYPLTPKDCTPPE